MPTGEGSAVSHVPGDGTIHPSPHHKVSFPLCSLLPSAFRLPLAEPHASSGTTVVLETGDSYLKQDFKSEKTHSMGLTLITTQTPLKRKPRPITPVLKTFQKFPVTLGITLKSLPCPTKAVHALTPASLPVHIFWSQVKCQSWDWLSLTTQAKLSPFPPIFSL